MRNKDWLAVFSLTLPVQENEKRGAICRAAIFRLSLTGRSAKTDADFLFFFFLLLDGTGSEVVSWQSKLSPGTQVCVCLCLGNVLLKKKKSRRNYCLQEDNGARSFFFSPSFFWAPNVAASPAAHSFSFRAPFYFLNVFFLSFVLRWQSTTTTTEGSFLLLVHSFSVVVADDDDLFFLSPFLSLKSTVTDYYGWLLCCCCCC